MTNTPPEMVSQNWPLPMSPSQGTLVNSRKRPAPTSDPGPCRRISFPISQPLQPREGDVQFGDSDLAEQFKCICSASAIGLLAREARAQLGTVPIGIATPRQDEILDFLKHGANPSYITQGTDFMHLLAEKVQHCDIPFLRKCLDCINANIDMGADYDLEQYFVKNPDVLFKFLDDENIFCHVLEKVEIKFDTYPSKEEELSMFEHALVEGKLNAAYAILNKTKSLPRVKGKETWQEYLVMPVHRTSLLVNIWKKIPWEEEGGQDAKREQGNTLYKKFCGTFSHASMKVLSKEGVDMSMNGSIFREVEIGCSRVDKSDLLLILESFHRRDLRNPKNYREDFFYNLCTRYKEEDAIEILQKIAHSIEPNKERFEFPLRAQKNDWRHSNALFRSRSHLTTKLKDTSKPKLAAALIILFGIKAPENVMDDARVAHWISHYGRLGFQHEQGGTGRVDCAVCYEPLNDGRVAKLLSGCTHIFHDACISRFQTNSCPTCRAGFVSQANRSVNM